MRPDEIHPGDLIAGKYRVRTILGRTHGLLVEAFHTEFDQRVIIKILLPGAGDEREIERFRREARTLAKLESEHVARIIDVGNQQDGSFYLVRQFLEGTDLATHIRQTGAQRLEDAVLFVLQAAEAVAETHSHGIISASSSRDLFRRSASAHPAHQDRRLRHCHDA
jgi:serine/threonine-protein kinase